MVVLGCAETVVAKGLTPKSRRRRGGGTTWLAACLGQQRGGATHLVSSGRAACHLRMLGGRDGDVHRRGLDDWACFADVGEDGIALALALYEAEDHAEEEKDDGEGNGADDRSETLAVIEPAVGQ